MNHRIFVGRDAHKFSAAHITVFPDGTKERLHGHNFGVRVAIDLKDIAFSSFLDFGVVKRAVDAQCREWNECLLLAEKCPYLEIQKRTDEELELRICGKRYVIPADEVLFLPVENVVVEALAVAFAGALLKRMVLGRDLVSGIEVEVTESPGQGAIYYQPL